MSEYIVYPGHMKRKRTAGDVTFGDQSETGIHIKGVTYTDPQGKIIPKHLIVKLTEGGSGFIFKILKTPIKLTKPTRSYAVRSNNSSRALRL